MAHLNMSYYQTATQLSASIIFLWLVTLLDRAAGIPRHVYPSRPAMSPWRWLVHDIVVAVVPARPTCG